MSDFTGIAILMVRRPAALFDAVVNQNIDGQAQASDVGRQQGGGSAGIRATWRMA